MLVLCLLFFGFCGSLSNQPLNLGPIFGLGPCYKVQMSSCGCVIIGYGHRTESKQTQDRYIYIYIYIYVYYKYIALQYNI